MRFKAGRTLLAGAVLSFLVVGCAARPATPDADIGVAATLSDLPAGVPGSPTVDSPVVTYNGGVIRFDLTPANYQPITSKEAAGKEFERLGLGDAQDPQLMAAPVLYTNYGTGPVDSQSNLTLSHDHEPAWLFVVPNYPFYPSGGSAAVGGTGGEQDPELDETPTLQNFILAISDTTGAAIVGMSAVPDETPVLSMGTSTDDAKSLITQSFGS